MSNSEPSQPINTAPTDNVLLCGVTGFLGAHLLHELMTSTNATIGCLVRGANQEHAKHSLKSRLSWYFGEQQLERLERRVRIIVGDISERQLGLPAGVYSDVAGSYATVVNAAANVSEVGAASQFFRVNTEGTSRLIELARTGIPKVLHHVSTVDVKGYFNGPTALESFAETRLEEGQVFRTPYADSKYRAEVLLRKAFAGGMAGAVYRVGYVAPHAGTGHFQQNIHQNYATRYVRACVRLGFAPYLPGNQLRLNPVDDVARAIVTVMHRAEPKGQTYHIDTPHHLTQYDVIRVLHAAGYAVRILKPSDFFAKARRVSQDEESLASVLPGAGTDDLRAIPMNSEWSLAELSRLGFEHSRPSSGWLGRFLAHAIDTGFLEAPRFWNLGAAVEDLF